jgi:hypothetical protein
VAAGSSNTQIQVVRLDEVVHVFVLQLPPESGIGGRFISEVDQLGVHVSRV